MRRVFVGLLAILTATAAPAVAQSVHDSLGWHLTANLGYVQTSGNTSLSTINLGDKLTFRPNAKWLFTQQASYVYGRQSGVESANQVIAVVRADYYLRANLSAYGLVGFERNPFAGITRRFEESVGLSWIAVRNARHELQVDLGVGNNQQLTGGVKEDFFVARVAPRYRYRFNERAYVEEQVEFLENLKNTGDLRTISLTSLVAPLTSSIAIRLSFLARYDAEPAVLDATAVPPTFYKKLDTTFTSGLQLSF